MFWQCFVALTVCLQATSVKCQRFNVTFEPENWYQALINCKNAGMELATAHTEEEQRDLYLFMTNINHDKNYWMGATKEGNGQFYWITGRKMVYTKWMNGQPNDLLNEANHYEGEHCLSWGYSTIYDLDPYGWDDRSCELPLPYICELSEYCYDR